MEPKYKVNPLTGELQEYVFEYNGILALRNFTARVEDERLILHAADDVNFSILEALVSEVEINGVVYDNPTAAQEALTRLTFNQNRPVLLDKTLKDLILGAVQKVEGKGLSSNDFTNAYKQQLDALEDYDIELDESTTELKFKKGNNVVRRISLMFLDDEGTKLVYNRTGKTLELRDKRDNLLTSIPVSHFVSNIPTSIVVQNGKIKLMAGSQVIDENTISYNDLTDKPDLNFAPANHTHYWDDIGGKPNNLATTDNIKTAVDGVQIGGRNLILNSKQKITKNEYAIASFLLSEEPKENEQVTFTLKGELGAGKSGFRLYNKRGYQELCILQDKGNGIYQQTFNWKKDPTNPLLVVIYVFHQNVIVNSTIEWIKLERGNKPTDWSPAPEDLANHEDVIQKVSRVGAAISSNWTAVVEHQNNTIFVENSLNIELNQLQNMGSVSFIKTFDTGAVTFTCAGKTIIMKGDTQFNGSKGSTAVVSIHNNDCYIRISNV